jgi:hypothetical protein
MSNARSRDWTRYSFLFGGRFDFMWTSAYPIGSRLRMARRISVCETMSQIAYLPILQTYLQNVNKKIEIKGHSSAWDQMRVRQDCVPANEAKQSLSLHKKRLPVGWASCPSSLIDRLEACPTTHSSQLQKAPSKLNVTVTGIFLLTFG